MAKITYKQNNLTAALLVVGVSLLLWLVFNLLVPAYPSNTPTSTVPMQNYYNY